MIGRFAPRRATFRPVKTSAFRSRWFAVLLACGALFWAPPLAGAERKRDAPPEIPPPAQPLAVKVARGENAVIQLRIFGRKNEPLKYLIRTPPEHGRLTAPRAVEREVSAVTYTPPADLAIVRDRFTYAVQTAAGVSAAVGVAITIVDVPPEIAVPEALVFPAILVGTTASRALEITNRGGGLAEGRVTVEAPWKIDGPANYRLAAGARAVFKVIFTPTEPGAFDTVMRFSSQPGTTLPVHAEARAALAVTPPNIVLQHAAGDPVRAGAFTLANQSDAELRVTLASTDRLTFPPELSVPAHSTVRVPVQVADGNVAALEGEVRAQSGDLTLRVPVRAAAVGAIVRATREQVSLGRVIAAQSAEAPVGLENIGGSAARVSWEIAAPFLAAGSPVTLGPGEKTSVIVRVETATPAKHHALLTVTADQQKLAIPVEAEVLAEFPPAAAQTAPAAFTPRPATAAAAPVAQPAARTIGSVIPDEMQVDLTSVPGVKVRDVTSKGATLEWPAAMTKASRFRVECRNVIVDSEGQFAVRWTPLPGVALRHEGESRIATITGLQPATAYGLRVVALASEGEAFATLFTQYFSTRVPASIWPKITPVRVLLVALLLCVAFVIRQRRAARRER